MHKKILITGASGFIGSHLVEEALKAGFIVFAGIRKTSSRAYLQHPEIHFIELNLASPVLLELQLNAFVLQFGNFDFVIHNAGLTQAENKKDFERVNSIYTKNLIQALINTGLSPEKFVLISSLAAYGPGNPQTYEPIKVTDKKMPVSAYGKSKAAAEAWLINNRHFPYLIINPAAVYGPRDKDFLQFVQLLQKGIEPYIGRNKQMVSLIYVKDLCRAIIGLLDTTSKNCAYLVSDRNSYNKEELGSTVLTILHNKTFKIKVPARIVLFFVKIIEAMYILFTGKLPFLNSEKINEISSPNWLCDSNPVWNSIRSSPFYTLEEGMLETIQWYQQHKWIK